MEPTPEQQRYMRTWGWRPEHEKWWDAFIGVWAIVGIVQPISHNLLVVAASDDMEQRKAAAFEVVGSLVQMIVGFARGES